jgi:hypothetical protein
MVNGENLQYFTIHNSLLTIHKRYSYGDSAGITTDFTFNPGFETGNQICCKCRENAIEAEKIKTCPSRFSHTLPTKMVGPVFIFGSFSIFSVCKQKTS